MIKNIDMSTARKGDYIIFANGIKGQIRVIYRNGGYFLRWDEFDRDNKKQSWSGSDKHCCYASYPDDAKLGFNDCSGRYIAHPYDIVEILKPPYEELQDKITSLEKKVKELSDV